MIFFSFEKRVECMNNDDKLLSPFKSEKNENYVEKAMTMTFSCTFTIFSHIRTEMCISTTTLSTTT